MQTKGLSVPGPKLRKENQIRTIHSTLAIEGNTLSLNQITDVLEGKRVRGRANEILEVQNALKLYEQVRKLNPFDLKHFLKAHGILMKGLVNNPGKIRTKNVGIIKGKKVIHAAPSAKMVSEQMNKLFRWLKADVETHILLKSCIAHYEIEFIHPFMDGNGRIGRFWQSLILMELDPVFQYLPMESIIREQQEEYYQKLRQSDKEGASTVFIEFILGVIEQSLLELIEKSPTTINTQEHRLELARELFKGKKFSRKEYMNSMPEISTATASRDLKIWFDSGYIKRQGERNQTKYFFV
ncbi:MAG: Fic family protein [Bdellovibrionales bacterium]|nr:Fic family protein [Bdellovibrionales bacterium]